MMKLGQMFSKERTHDMSGRSNVWDGSLADSGIVTSGFATGTQVATCHGWRDVEMLRQGDMVLTFDDGLQKVARVERTVVGDDHVGLPMQHWPLRIPKGALGNHSEMTLFPEQSIVVESDLAEAMFGDPFTLVPACALVGYKGIERLNPRGVFDVVSFYFDTEQVVFANVGALVHCTAAQSDLVVDLAHDSCGPGYDVLSMTQAARFVAAMITNSDQDASWASTEVHTPEFFAA